MRFILSFFCVLVISSCNKKSGLSINMDCSKELFLNLETIEDVKKSFVVQFPEDWKTNLYYDESQSSIYTADTTKQLTETMLLDITSVNKKITFDSLFVKKLKNNLKQDNLEETFSKELIFHHKNAYYTKAIGTKRSFDYQIAHLFIAIDQNNYIHSKIEVYGDSLVNERMCKGLQLIEKIQYLYNE